MHRSLSIKGKVTIANSLVISLFQYPCSYIHTPPEVFKELKSIFTKFLWNNKKPKVAYSTLILPVADGGLNLFDLESRAEAAHVQAIRRIIHRPHLRSADYIRHLLKTDELSETFRSRPKSLPITILRIPYYTAVFRTWFRFHNFYPAEENSIRSEALWNNKWITTTNGPLHNHVWARKGIGVIQDICHPHEGRLLSHSELTTRYNVCCTFVDMLAIRLSIPLHWRQSLSPDWISPPIFPGGPTLAFGDQDPQEIAGLTAKRAYSGIVSSKKAANTAFHRWKQNPPNIAIGDREEWARVCLRMYRTVKETKLQSFQFKVIQAITPCRKYLRQLRLADDDLCTHCGVSEDLFHFFFECQLVRNFWSSICAWLAREANIHLYNITTKEAVLGMDDTSTEGRITNFILLHFRFFVHRQRLFHDNKFETIHWLAELRTRLLTMENNLKIEGKAHLFSKWECLTKALG